MKRLILFLIIVIFSFLVATSTAAQSASFYLSPESGDYDLGETFPVSIFVNVQGTTINAAQATVYFPSEILKVIDISKKDSIFTVWFQEPVWSNSRGEILFGGGLPRPGYIGEAGEVITIFFQGKSEGRTKVDFGKEAIVANDPKGLNIFSFSQGGIYSVFPSGVVPPPIDSQFPLEVFVDNEGDPTNPRPLLYLGIEDETAELNYYEIKIGQGDRFRVSEREANPFRLPLQAPGTQPITVRAVSQAGSFAEGAAEVKIESISVPQIIVCPGVFVPEEELLHLEGSALPNHKVMVFFEKDGKSIKKWEVFSDEEGNWLLRTTGLFKSGIYKISARTEDSRGAVSNPSEACLIKVIFHGIAIGSWLVSYSALVWVFLIVLICVLMGIFYLSWRIRRTRKIIEKETQDLKQKFYKEYQELQADIERELEVLRKLRTGQEITREEQKREKELLKNLADVKEVFEKELKDIEEIK